MYTLLLLVLIFYVLPLICICYQGVNERGAFQLMYIALSLIPVLNIFVATSLMASFVFRD